LVHKGVSQYVLTWIVVIISHFLILYLSRGTPNGAPVEPFWISSQHLVVELLRNCGISRELLKIENVLPGLSEDPSAVIIVLHILWPVTAIRGLSDSILSNVEIHSSRF
jgi:hypothetical protein